MSDSRKSLPIMLISYLPVWRIALLLGVTSGHVRQVLSANRVAAVREKGMNTEQMAEAERRRSLVVSLGHLPVAKIIEELNRLGVKYSYSRVCDALHRAGIKPAVDESLRSQRLSEAYAKSREQRVAASKAAYLRQKDREYEYDAPGKFLKCSVSIAELERARRILSATGDINKAARAIDMDPVRLQRQINHMR